MPELPELEVVQEVLNRRIVGQTIAAAELIQPGGAMVVRDLVDAMFQAVRLVTRAPRGYIGSVVS